MSIFAALYYNKAVASEPYLQAHIDFLADLRERGTVLANGRLLEGPGGLVLLRAASVEQAHALLVEDPFIVHDIRRLEIFEWALHRAPGVSLGVQDDPAIPVAEIDVGDLRAALDARAPLTLIDVREDHEVAIGRIESARHIPLETLEARLGDLPPGELVFICRGGGRSARACRLLARHGRRDTRSVAGGMTAWSALLA